MINGIYNILLLIIELLGKILLFKITLSSSYIIKLTQPNLILVIKHKGNCTVYNLNVLEYMLHLTVSCPMIKPWKHYIPDAANKYINSLAHHLRVTMKREGSD